MMGVNRYAGTESAGGTPSNLHIFLTQNDTAPNGTDWR